MLDPVAAALPDPVAAASGFSGFPVWVLLDPFASFGGCRNHTTASSLTSAKVPIEVSFELVDPPRVSRWFVHRVGRKKYRGFNGPPYILNSSGSFMVICMSLYRGSDRVLDYFVYKSEPGKPSLDLIPEPCPAVNFHNRIAILPSDDGGHYSVIFPVAELRTGPMYEIRVYSSADQSWSTKFASIDSQTTYLQAVAHHPSKAIAAGRGSLAWIDLWRGVLMCDGLEEDNPVLRLIKWPVPLPCRNAMDLYSADGSRDATLSDSTIRFVEIKFHYSGGCFHSGNAIPIGWTATMWKRRCSSREWEVCFEVDIAKILTNQSCSDLLQKVWDTKSNKLDLNKVSSAPPTLSLTNEDVVYFMTNLFSNEALLIAVNARKKKLEAVEQTFFDLPLSPYSFSRILYANSGIDMANLLDKCSNRDKVECVGTSLLAALDELKDIGGDGGRLRGKIGMTETNGGGAAMHGSAGDVDSSVEDKVVAEHCSMELPRQNWSLVDVADDSQPVEKSSKRPLRCPTAGFQDDLPVTKMDDTPVTNVDDVEFTFEERPQTDTVEENLSMHKINTFIKEEVCKKQIDPEIPTEDQFSTSQKHDTLLMDQTSSVKNPFNLDDDRNDNLIEIPTESCFLEVPNAVESRQQVHSTSLMVDQPTVCNQTRMAEAQQCHISNEHILSSSSASENGEMLAPEDTTVSSSSELVNKTCFHGVQQCHIFVPSQAASTELSTMSMQSALSEVKAIMQTEDASAKDMTAVHSFDCIQMNKAIDTAANDTYAANFEQKKLIEGSATGMNEVRQADYIEEQTQASDAKELSAVQNIGNFEENKKTEDTDPKETNTPFNASDVEHKMQTAKEMAAAEITCSCEEKQQLNIMVGQDGSNNELNEEIASTGAQLNSVRVRVPLKVLLAEASMENQAKKPSTKGPVLSFGRWLTKDSNFLVKSGSPKSGSDDHHWSSPAKLPHKDVHRSSKEKKTGAQLNSGRVSVPLKVFAVENQVKKPSTKERVRLPHKDVDSSSKENKQQWMPVICCHSVR